MLRLRTMYIRRVYMYALYTNIYTYVYSEQIIWPLKLVTILNKMTISAIKYIACKRTVLNKIFLAK